MAQEAARRAIRGRPGRDEDSTGLVWTVQVDGPAAGSWNMARDHALAVTRQPGEAFLRLYRWERPTVSFGRNQPARGLYDETEAGRMGVGFVRRPTGGRAVLHDAELTYSVVAPLRALGGLKPAFGAIHRGILIGLRALGVAADQAPLGGAARPPDGVPCFAEASGGELVVGGRKLVGSAQARVGESILQHGSILLAGGQGPVVALGGGSGGGSAPITLSETLGHAPDLDRLVERLVAGMEEALGGAWVGRAPPSAAALAAATDLEGRYASEEWTWRR